jgi:hypothetical protein
MDGVDAGPLSAAPARQGAASRGVDVAVPCFVVWEVSMSLAPDLGDHCAAMVFPSTPR